MKHVRVSVLWTLVIMIGVAAMPLFASTTNYYVRTNGSDSATGFDWANAVQTISNAVAKAAAIR